MNEILNQNLDKKDQILKNDAKINKSIYSTGRRKKSIARDWLKEGTGNIIINGKKMVDYFKRNSHQMTVSRPFVITKKTNEFDILCTVKGGGQSGQAGAIIHGISRALVTFDPSLKTILKKEKLTTRDSRAVERKKYGLRKARRSYQFSKR